MICYDYSTKGSKTDILYVVEKKNERGFWETVWQFTRESEAVKYAASLNFDTRVIMAIHNWG